MELYDVLKDSYPNATFDDFELVDNHDGNGPKIDVWNVQKLGAKPNPFAIKSMGKKLLVEKALAAKQDEIETLFNDHCMKDFEYKGHMYKADYLQIQGMSTNCILLGYEAELPTIGGMWTTNEYEADGVTLTRVAFTCGEFLEFAKFFSYRRAINYDNMQKFIKGVMTFRKNISTVSLKDVTATDVTKGWV